MCISKSTATKCITAQLLFGISNYINWNAFWMNMFYFFYLSSISLQAGSSSGQRVPAPQHCQKLNDTAFFLYFDKAWKLCIVVNYTTTLFIFCSKFGRGSKNVLRHLACPEEGCPPHRFLQYILLYC